VESQDRLRRPADHLKAWNQDYAQRGRVWGGSVKHPGQRVGLPHKLIDGDLVTIITAR
jgi:ribosome-interacting GTPase 1